jgi:hypothetical protein
MNNLHDTLQWKKSNVEFSGQEMVWVEQSQVNNPDE